MRALLLILGHLLSRAGVRLQARALEGAGIVGTPKPPMRTEPEQLPAPRPVMPLPPPQVLDAARDLMALNDQNQVKVCRGSKKGCDGREDQIACADCYAVMWHDQRPSAEILQAMERGDA